MKLSLNWLKDYLDIKISAKELAEKLTLAGLAVDAIEDLSRVCAGIVVGQIKEIQPHPNADRLQVVKVLVSKAKKLTIVCGASNIAVGQKVPVAQVGSALSNGLQIKQSEIRGVLSEGMLCSAQELGLGDEHLGIFILSEQAVVGQSLSEHLYDNDTVFDIDVTPNRGDCLSVLGLAREIGAIVGDVTVYHRLGQKIVKEATIPNEYKDKTASIVRVEVKDPALCPFYAARVVQNVKIAESPEWLQARLRAVGLKPINNVVDSTNYVMLAYGHPLHAFDAQKVTGVDHQTHQIIVRHAKSKEQIRTLDGHDRELSDDMLVIADPKRVLAIAGIMGAEWSAVSADTNAVILESAVFDKTNVGKTMRALGLRSDAGARFEKGVDFEMASMALDRVAQLIAEIAQGRILEGRVMVSDSARKRARPRIVLPKKQIFGVLGVEISEKMVEKILTSLGFAVMPTVEDWIVMPPSFRHDVEIPEDVIEELGRMWGYDKIVAGLPTMQMKPAIIDSSFIIQQEVRRYFVSAGFDEVLHHSAYGIRELQETDFPETAHIRVLNPMNQGEQYLRRTLAPKIVQSLAMNRAYTDRVALFEIGGVFAPSLKQPLPIEAIECACAYSAYGQNPETAFRVVKGAIDELLRRLGVVAWEWSGGLGSQSELKIGKVKIGNIRVVAKDDHNKLRSPAAWAVMSVTEAMKHISHHLAYQPIPVFPAVERDVSLIFDVATEYGMIEKEIFTAGKLLQQVVFVDEYAVEAGKSLTFRLVFQPEDKTLEKKEIEVLVNEIVEHLIKRFHAKQR